jgi:predicted cobalt transporter CbtA
MSREPAYPKDAPVAPPPAAAGAAAAGADEAGGTAKSGDSRRRKQIMTGAAIGIGSAAIVAALLYANRSRRPDRG